MPAIMIVDSKLQGWMTMSAAWRRCVQSKCKSDDFAGTDQHGQRRAVDHFQRADEDGSIQPSVRSARRCEFQTRTQIGMILRRSRWLSSQIEARAA